MTEISYGYCHCGCGEKTNIAQYTDPKYGWMKGEPLKYLHNHHFRGKRNVNYNMGFTYDKKTKRWFIHCREGRYQYARAVMECHLKRNLISEEVVHHINGDSTDDRIENLMLFENNAEHMKHHITYTDDELLEIIRKLNKSLGREPQTSDLEKDKNLPTRETYRKRFGGFLNAKKLAGVGRGKVYVGPYTDSELLLKLRGLYEETGKIPTCSDIRKRADMPSTDTYRVRFGGVANARKLAGLEPERGETVGN